MNPSEPQYTQVSGSDLYWLDSAAQLAGFLASPNAGLGPAPLLSATWADAGGVYVFLGAPPADAGAFAAALRANLVARGWPNGPRFAWIADPAISPFAWSMTTVDASAAASPVVTRRADFVLATYTLSILPGTTITLAGAADGWGFTFARAAPAAQLYAPGGIFPCTGGSVVLSYAAPGSWRVALALDAPHEGTSGLARLGAGLRYFAADAGGYVSALQLDVLRQPPASVPLYATIDPLRPLDPARTAFSFFPFGGGAGPGAFGSGYATARGYYVDLTPQPAGAQTPAASLVFAFHPYVVDDGTVPGEYYLVPSGTFGVTVRPPLALVRASASLPPPSLNRMTCGMSGLEYVGLPAAGGTMVFVPGRAAFAPASVPENALPLTALGTTAWAYLGAASPVSYYAQPEDAPLFTVPGPSSPVPDPNTSVFLDFFEMPTIALPPPDAVRAFPMAPYRDVDPALVPLARDLEARAIAPARRAEIARLTRDAWSRQTTALAGVQDDPSAGVGVTPQGLAVGVVQGGATWTWLGVANETDGAAEPNLRFTRIGGRFRQAMQTNRLFMVLGDPDAVISPEGIDVAYQLTPHALGVIGTLPANQGVPPDVLAAVSAYMAAQHPPYPVYATEAAFDAALTAAYAAITPEQVLVFQRNAGLLTPLIDQWRFQLSPRNWVNPLRHDHRNAFLIFKFTLGTSIADLVADTSQWTWPQASFPGGRADFAQAAIQHIIADARTACAPGSPPAASPAAAGASPYCAFVADVDDPNWTGILALSCAVPLDTLPEALQMLAAGIDPNTFYAHHLGIRLTPYEASATAFRFQRTSMFGLIDYQNPEDQYFSSDIAYAFRVLRLTAQFRNSAIAGFSSTVQLLVNRLFGTDATLAPTQHGNNVLLAGVYQEQRLPDGSVQQTYVFELTGTGTFQLTGTVLQSVEVLSMQLVTSKAASLGSGDSTVQATFRIGGNLRFDEIAQFDPFCFGPLLPADVPPPIDPSTSASALRFDGLAVGMSFALGDPGGTTVFTLDTADIAFDLGNSVPRDRSLLKLFPLTLTGFVSTPDPAVDPSTATTASPQDLGYVSVSAPLAQGTLQQPWYGLQYRIDLGDLGALAASAGLSLQVLAAWSRGASPDDPPVYLGVKLPGVKDALGVTLPLQGIIDLSFRTIQFRAFDDPLALTREYSLRFRDFALRFLGLAFPPGHNDVYLFGNPDPESNTKVGWYAAYAKENDKKKKGTPSSRQLVRASRFTVRRPR